MNNTGLYIHVPFCKSKCPYCDFYSLTFNKQLEEDYTSAVVRNLSKYEGAKIDTIYFGGGTPSLLSTQSFSNIFNAIEKYFVLDNQEITLEANPATLDKTKLKELKNIGFNRISFGIQSMVDNELEKLGRLHNAKEAKQTVLDAYSAGFKNISADLMIGISNQTMDSLENSLSEFCKLPLTHISAYLLKIEPNTPYFKLANNLNIPNDDLSADMYLFTVNYLKEHGFYQYEISNFAKENYQSKHNLKYWNCEKYIGIGPSSHSFYNNKRYEVPRDFNKFISNEFQTEIINENNPANFYEKAMLCLRLSSGLSRKICDEFGYDFDKILQKAKHFKKANLICATKNNISLTKEGFLLSNTIISEILD